MLVSSVLRSARLPLESGNQIEAWWLKAVLPPPPFYRRVDPPNLDLYRARVGLAFNECVRVGVLRTLAPLGACEALAAADKEVLKAVCPALYRTGPPPPPVQTPTGAAGAGGPGQASAQTPSPLPGGSGVSGASGGGGLEGVIDVFASCVVS
jgi:hypothetical protein